MLDSGPGRLGLSTNRQVQAQIRHYCGKSEKWIMVETPFFYFVPDQRDAALAFRYSHLLMSDLN